MTLRRSYRLFWTGQSISSLGSSFSTFALPLLVFKLTGSAANLAFTTAAGFVPFLLFGLAVGAWVDRLDRRRAMIFADLGRAVAISSVPLLAALGSLHVWWVYLIAFVNTTLWIVSSAAETAAVPSLVPKDDLVAANGQLQGTYAVVQVVGPLLAGALVGGGLPVTGVFAVDAASFVVSAVLLLAIRTPFNAERARPQRSVLADVGTGLRYVLSHPLLRAIAALAALFNLIGATTWSQLVLFANTRLSATDTQVGVLFAGGSLGTAVVLFTAGRLRERVPFAVATLGALISWGLLIVGLAATGEYWLGVVLWSAAAGLPFLFSVRTLALRQAIVPEHLLGRVQTVAQVLAWGAQPLGALAGAWVIEATGDIAAVYAGSGLLIVVISASFWRTALGRGLVDAPVEAPTDPPTETPLGPLAPLGERRDRP